MIAIDESGGLGDWENYFWVIFLKNFKHQVAKCTDLKKTNAGLW